MDKQESLVKHYDGRGHYGLSFNKIRFLSDNLLQNHAMQEKKAIKDLQKNITFTLIKANPGGYIRHIFKKFYDSTWIFIFVPFLMLISSSLNFFRHKSKLSLLIIFISCHSLANHAIVYLFGRVQPRYLLNTDLILLTFLFILTFIFLSQKEIKKS